MKSGDMVRFVHPTEAEWKLGLLIEYHKWEKIATVLYEGGLMRIAARHVQKFGKRYLVMKDK
tara:strand:- start:390 stop:575 length:186 start_codon:yes stop_codon:yes gene_type:complete